jgi:hypothetical protein
LFYDVIIKLIGAGIASVLYFLPFQLQYPNEILTVEACLTAPITHDIESLIKKGFNLRIQYSFTIIINDKRSYYVNGVNTIRLGQNWLVNDSLVPYENLQKSAGCSIAHFNRFKFDEGDKMMVFVNAHILPDEGFTLSTGFQPSILWSYYVPRLQEIFLFKNGAFIKQ